MNTSTFGNFYANNKIILNLLRPDHVLNNTFYPTTISHINIQGLLNNYIIETFMDF